MPIPVTQKFLNAAGADSNLPVAQVQLLLGNYFSSAAYGTTAGAQGAQQQANYPASGAVDGDRTEINVGPAGGADNDIGLSSWRSASPPDDVGTINLIITMTQSRIINRIKLYHLSGHALKSFFLTWWDGANWQPLAATTDQGPGNGVLFNTTGTLDVIDFPDVTTTQVRLSVVHTAVAHDDANVVEIEAYRKIDITSRVKGVKVQRQRDYKLDNPMAAQLTLDCTNDDRFFSISHIPTSTELASGFVNQELAPGVNLIVSYGFTYYSTNPELVSSFVGTIDRIQVRPKTRDAVIEARDGMKQLINRIDSSKLKTSQTIDSNIRYVLNRANISNYEMALDPVSIDIDYFFTDAQAQLDSIRDLTQAAVDAAFYFDEMGIATFKNYTTLTPQNKVFTSQTDFQTGTFTGSMVTVPDQLELSPTNGGTGELVSNQGQSTGQLNTPASPTGVRQLGFSILPTIDGTINSVSAAIIFQGPSGTTGTIQIQLCADNSGVPGTVLQSISISHLFSPNQFTLGNETVNFTVSNNTLYWLVFAITTGTLVNSFIVSMPTGATGSWSGGGNAKARTETTAWQDVEDTNTNTPIGTVAGSYVLTGNALTGTWTSPSVDTGTSTTSFGLLTNTQVLNSGSITWFTRSSPNLVTFSPFVAIGGNGQIQSPTARYLQAKVEIDLGSSSNPSPLVLDVTLNWNSGAGSSKYPPAPSSFTFRFDSTLLDLQQEIADNLGGDTSILNDVTVQAQPLVLTGANTDTVWQGSTGVPPVNISGTVPLSVTMGQVITLSIFVSGGMDTSNMSGANPSAAAVVFGAGATGSWSFTSIHPTLPVLVINVTNGGTITDLRLVGKTFSSSTYVQAQRITDADSVAKYGGRQLSISNTWIVGSQVASTIATSIVNNFKAPTTYIPKASVRPMFSVQINDRVTVVDINTDLSADYLVVGVEHDLAVTDKAGTAQTDLTLLQVPAGF